MDANTIIDRIGGTATVATLCEVTPQAVSQWRKDGIPKARLMFLRAVRPDVFELDAVVAVSATDDRRDAGDAFASVAA